MKNFIPTLIAYSSIWIVLAGYFLFSILKKADIEQKLESLKK